MQAVKKDHICDMINCDKRAEFYRKLDENPRPLCTEHYEKFKLQRRNFCFFFLSYFLF